MKRTPRCCAFLLALLMIWNLTACQKSNRVDNTAEIPQKQEEKVENSATSPEAEMSEEDNQEPIEIPAEAEAMQAAFDDFIYNEFIAQLDNDYLSIHYSLLHPEDYGIDPSSAEISLGEGITEDYLAEGREENRQLQETLEQFQYDLLRSDQQETYLLYQYLLDLAIESTDEDFAYMGGAFTPMQGLQNDIASLLMEFEFYSENDVKAYLELMRDVPRYVDAMLEYSETQAEKGYFMPDVSTQSTIDYCRKIIKEGENSALLHAVLTNIKNCAFLGDIQVSQYQTEASEIFCSSILPSYEQIVQRLSALMGAENNQLGLAHFPRGNEYYEHLFKVKTGSERSVEECKELLETYLNGSISAIADIAANNRPAYRAYLYQGIHTGYDGIHEILNDLEQTVFNNFPYIEPVDYTVSYLDSQVAVDGISAYYVVPPLDSSYTQKIKVNPNGSVDPDTPSTFCTLAHEGLPGHLYQTNYVLQNLKDPFRKSVSILGYSEGYATYVELIALNYLKDLEQEEDNELAFEEDEVTLEQYYSLFQNCLIALCDIGIHYEGWSVQDCENFLSQYIEIDSAQSIFDQLVGDPAGFLSYYVGCVEFLELRQMAQEALGSRFDELSFHESILQGGDLPFALLKQRVEQYIAEKQ